MSAECYLDSVPHELVQLITGLLPRSEHRRLCSTSRSFGQQPTQELITRLSIHVPALDCSRLGLLDHKSRLSHVREVNLRSGFLSEAGIHGQLQEECTSLDQLQLLLFAVRIVPAMRSLTKVTLQGLPLSAAVAFATCLAGAGGRPPLAHLALQGVTRDEEAGRAPLTLSHLWPALAAISTLRRLKLDSSVQEDSWSPSLEGVGALTQLQRLSLSYVHVQLSELSPLVGLIKLTLSSVACLLLEAPYTPSEADAGLNPSLQALSRLQCLTLNGVDEREDTVESALPAFAACRGLTCLRLGGPCDSANHPQTTLLPLHSRLVRLDADALAVHHTQLQALPALRALRCRMIDMPPAVGGAGAGLPQLRALACRRFKRPRHADGASAAPLSLAQTFPRLTAFSGEMFDGWDELVPMRELLPATPAGQFAHLRFLVTPHAATLIAACRGTVEELHVQDDGESTVRLRRPADVVLALQGAGPQLRRVHSCRGRLGDSDLFALINSWPGVEEVMLESEHAVTDLGLVALARLPRLRRVALVRCPAVTAGAVAALAARWSVEVIEVCGCDLVGEADVWPLISRPQLDIVHSLVEAEAAPWWGGAGEDVAA